LGGFYCKGLYQKDGWKSSLISPSFASYEKSQDYEILTIVCKEFLLSKSILQKQSSALLYQRVKTPFHHKDNKIDGYISHCY
ncbi:hypothetical protein, partial [Pseudomonas syringae]|uniref:hypothetical protein n=1 Tax=Pseudomonas syringae TaxID=317 RepID=UPI0034D6C9E5